ncbi:tetracycline resistance efflux system leader peptide [Bacillus subtilis]|uniref:tetracycline resistance efflux system leader peptide n=1 Tax=Bacillus TaxID=1386 RepID=UPI000DF78C3C|nr:tetracycline resistance efflux system leader peptide [Bacillus subtilis]NCT22958.1 tetracycline resistance efflux system leader peptide [Bacillus subtilis subsp. subtilis]HCJ7961818.1 tetracycline resistance efflux system leader peptide [Klebsiella pneumoniae]MBT2223547.1 tetracycline resistance efflux system leader peptide [Bacillus subtilis]QAT59908.1 tetracycline resistance efflux system leader peptide [Bacillus subtilis]
MRITFFLVSQSGQIFIKKSKSLNLSLYIIRSYQSNVGGVIMKCNKMNRVQLKEGSVSMTL